MFVTSMLLLHHLCLLLSCDVPAVRVYQKGSQRADEYIRMIKDNLEVAVEQCIEAAGHEFEPSIQKSLLRVSTPRSAP